MKPLIKKLTTCTRGHTFYKTAARPTCPKCWPGRYKKKNTSRLTRPKHPMPAFVKQALSKHGLMALYKARPPYQQNDYIGWIARAAEEETKQKRLNQMLSELKRGGVYMKMKWRS